MELHCVQRFTRVEEEGHADHFFNRVEADVVDNDSSVVVSAEDRNSRHRIDPVEVPANFLHMSNHAEDIAMIRGMGMMVDDDNAPAPENVPDAKELEKDKTNEGLKEGQEWGCRGFNERKVNCIPNIKPSIKGMNQMTLDGMGTIGMFILFLERE